MHPGFSGRGGLHRRCSLTGLALLGAWGCGLGEDPEYARVADVFACTSEPVTIRYSFETPDEYYDPRVSVDPNERLGVVERVHRGPDAVSGAVDARCPETPGIYSVALKFEAMRDGRLAHEETQVANLLCRSCPDGGVDGGVDAGSDAGTDAGPSPWVAESFFAPLFADSIADFADSIGAGSEGSDSVVDQVAMGSEVEAATQASMDHSFNLSTYECGVEEGGMRTVCASEGVMPMPEGELVTVVMDVAEPVPLASSETSYVFAAVFDSDGDAANDFVPLPAYPWDYYQATDRWYELIYDHEAGAWSAQVTQLDASGTRTAVASTLRAVIQDARVTFFLSRAELPGAAPAYRTTSFRHDGAYTVATRAGDVPMANPTLSLFPLGCGYTGAECGASNGALADCGADHQCVTESSRGLCIPTGLSACGGALPACSGGASCMTEGDAIGSPAYCVPEAVRACICASAAGRHVFPSCA